MRTLLITLCLMLSPLAAAQVGLPSVRVPQVPGGLPALPQTGLSLTPGTPTQAAELDPQRLRLLRSLRVRELLRRHRDVIEADPLGNPVVRGEVLALAPAQASLQAAASAGFAVVRRLPLSELGTSIVVLHVSGSTTRALARLQGADPAGAYDFNHVYTDSGAWSAARDAPPAAVQAVATAAAEPQIEAASAGTAGIGLIDSGVDATHEVFGGLTLHQHGCSGQAVPAEHGTAVASLMVGRAAALHGAAPGAALYAADVFCGRPAGGAVDAVAEAFAWLVHEQVPVINVSLVGPPNRLLEGIVEAVVARGHLVVAAVGNDGPAAPPLYPAAWPGVVGVTAVDARSRVLVEAERGPQVMFAAPGADMAAARLAGGYTLVRGTSFAAPIVAGLLAGGLRAPDKAAADAAIATLARSAQDLGPAGRDPIYGYGLVGAQLRRQPALAALRAD
jgi:subtilisin family serine protease